jgi:hypothetical protein
MSPQIKYGRDFRAGDRDSVVITASLAKLIGSGSVVGKDLRIPWDMDGKTRSFPIVG